MVISATDWRINLRKLLPRGRLWRFLLGGWLDSTLLAMADVLAQFEADANRLPLEADPRTTCKLLPDWEASCGLPDDCLPGGGTHQQRRNAIVGKLRATGGCNFTYYIQLALAYGYTITCEDLDTDYWRVNSPLPSGLVNSTCDMGCDDPIEVFGVAQLECLIKRVKQSHTEVIFAYAG
jgi:uncharacterized protein YmfQ (DUF2313 family)